MDCWNKLYSALGTYQHFSKKIDEDDGVENMTFQWRELHISEMTEWNSLNFCLVAKARGDMTANPDDMTGSHDKSNQAPQAETVEREAECGPGKEQTRRWRGEIISIL